MRCLVACESSGVVREAFRKRGHDAWSCDLLPAEDRSRFHYREDVRETLQLPWDLIIAHPPCTYLCNSGVRWFTTIPAKPRAGVAYGQARELELTKAVALFRAIWESPCARVAIENPVMHGYAQQLIGVKFTQSIQPWQFGHKALKRTCLWLRGLPALQPTDVLRPPRREDYTSGPEGDAYDCWQAEYRRWARVHQATPGPDRWRERSRTYQGIADAMAEQWG